MTAIHRSVEACRRGSHPRLIARLASGWAVMGESQILAGYCLLLPDPPVAHLNELAEPHRTQFLADMSRLGDAVLQVTGAVRINYAMFGNLEPALHAHVHPRYADEPEPQRLSNPWSYDMTAGPHFDPAVHTRLLVEIREHLLAALPERAAD